MTDGVTDEVLMGRYQQGEADAFTVLYQRHRDGLFRYLLKGCRIHAVAEEIFQDVWTEVINARARYRPQAPFAAWLFRIGRNRMIDHLRRAGHAATPQVDDNVVQLAATQPAELPEQRMQAADEMSRFRHALNELPFEQREAFVLKHEKSFSLAEIAEITGVNAETAKSRLRYAMSKLREILHNPQEHEHGTGGQQ